MHSMFILFFVFLRLQTRATNSSLAAFRFIFIWTIKSRHKTPMKAFLPQNFESGDQLALSSFI